MIIGQRLKFIRGAFKGSMGTIVPVEIPSYVTGWRKSIYTDPSFISVRLDGGKTMRILKCSSAIRELSPLEALAEVSA